MALVSKVSCKFFATDLDELDDFIEHVKSNMPDFHVLEVSMTAYESSADEVEVF